MDIKYLGKAVHENINHRDEIVARIEQVRKVFIRMKKLLTAKDLSLALRMEMTRGTCFQGLVYDLEGWTLIGNILELGCS